MKNYYDQANEINYWLQEQRSTKKYSERSILEAASLVREIQRNAEYINSENIGEYIRYLQKISTATGLVGDLATATSVAALSYYGLGKNSLSDSIIIGLGAYSLERIKFAIILAWETRLDPEEYAARYADEAPQAHEQAALNGAVVAGAALGLTGLRAGKFPIIPPETQQTMAKLLLGALGLNEANDLSVGVATGVEMVRTGLSGSEGDVSAKQKVTEGVSKLIASGFDFLPFTAIMLHLKHAPSYEKAPPPKTENNIKPPDPDSEDVPNAKSGFTERSRLDELLFRLKMESPEAHEQIIKYENVKPEELVLPREWEKPSDLDLKTFIPQGALELNPPTGPNYIAAGGYRQVMYRGSRIVEIDGKQVKEKYEIRWHTKTPDAPPGTLPNWRLSRTRGKISEVGIKDGNGGVRWIDQKIWKEAEYAYHEGTATDAQKMLLNAGHFVFVPRLF
jgi:hypothetical protein